MVSKGSSWWTNGFQLKHIWCHCCRLPNLIVLGVGCQTGARLQVLRSFSSQISKLSNPALVQTFGNLTPPERWTPQSIEQPDTTVDRKIRGVVLSFLWNPKKHRTSVRFMNSSTLCSCLKNFHQVLEVSDFCLRSDWVPRQQNRLGRCNAARTGKAIG